MGVRTGIASLLVLCALALPAGPAVAAPTTVPPDNSAAAQYTEALPGAGGNRPTRDLGGRRGGDGGAGALSAEQRARLRALGEEGADAARLADAFAAGTGAASATANGGGTDATANGGAADVGEDAGSLSPNPDGSSGPAQILGAIAGSSDSGGIGPLLPLLLALTAAAALGYTLTRRRNRPS